MKEALRETEIPFSAGAVLISVGVVYGDIGTSPMYVMKSIIAGNGGVAQTGENVIYGALSLVIWTIILLTTVKYVLIAMRADNHNEGGIFALFSLVKKCGKWLVFPAMIGGAALLADGILTPAVTVTTAIEGLRSIPGVYAVLGNDQDKIVVITLVIISGLFLVQKAGTSSIGKAFGPVMTLWFLFLAAAGCFHILGNPGIIQALNPLWAIRILISPDNRMGFMILGSVFLATTGAEALYSDMGHVGRQNIYASWPFVKICLILNYLGQGAWLLSNRSSKSLADMPDMNPFFEMLPEEIRPAGVVLGTIAAIIASQALVTGSFTLVSEASRLDLMPHMQIVYPSMIKGQIFIPLVNLVLWISCSLLVLYFRTSAHMEAAYGLAITLTMLMTTLLLFIYLNKIRKKYWLSWLFLVFFGGLEGTFFLSSLSKFQRGGYVALFIAAVLFGIMVVWYRGTAIENSQAVYLKVRDFVGQMGRLKEDTGIPIQTDNLVYITKETRVEELDRDILYSVLDRPKRARAYWFINIQVTDQPYTREYTVENFGTDYIFKIQLRLGFKVDQRINVYLRQIVEELIDSNELPSQEPKYSIYGSGEVGSFQFCLIRKLLIPESDITPAGRAAVSLKYAIRRVAGSSARWYGLENSALILEYVPLFIKMKNLRPLRRV
ncbi:KUP/HAK/KT family potassium transporter [Blautia hominis]|uniref:Probable potassium transport system protein Kup n=1 Tax=Blautia hominis TaxID=2025493 RepID=A0ABQ0BB94_9FIRM